MTQRAFAIGAHPDDIEFVMAGTLLLLKNAGFEIHYMNLATGSCGSLEHDGDTTARTRRGEAMKASALAGAVFHESLVHDLEILYELKTLRRLTAIMREVAPTIVLTHFPYEYMEDHTTTCRLVLTAAFIRAAPNFAVTPPRPPVDAPVTVYHSLPLGQRDPLRRRLRAGMYVDIGSVLETKREMLAQHRSQKEWLDVTQGMHSYLNAMTAASREVGGMSRRFEYAEGWTRHLATGYCAADANPLLDALPGLALVDEAFERGLG